MMQIEDLKLKKEQNKCYMILKILKKEIIRNIHQKNGKKYIIKDLLNFKSFIMKKC